jgi:hypothetical protein
MAEAASYVSGLVEEVTHENDLPGILDMYKLNDQPDSFILQGKGVIILKNYGKFVAEVEEWRKQLD